MHNITYINAVLKNKNDLLMNEFLNSKRRFCAKQKKTMMVEEQYDLDKKNSRVS